MQHLRRRFDVRDNRIIPSECFISSAGLEDFWREMTEKEKENGCSEERISLYQDILGELKETEQLRQGVLLTSDSFDSPIDSSQRIVPRKFTYLPSKVKTLEREDIERV